MLKLKLIPGGFAASYDFGKKSDCKCGKHKRTSWSFASYVQFSLPFRRDEYQMTINPHLSFEPVVELDRYKGKNIGFNLYFVFGVISIGVIRRPELDGDLRDLFEEIVDAAAKPAKPEIGVDANGAPV